MRAHRGLGRRRALLASAVVLVVGAGGGFAAFGDGGLSITPPSGPPGSSYDVTVTCGNAPLVKRRNLQDDPVQGTIGAFPADDEVSPSVWAMHETAGRADAAYFATCDGADAGTGRFDAEAPHLWFGPRPQYIGEDQLHPRTQVEGTDCPAGTTAKVTITTNGKASTADATIDQYGDWSVALPTPVGSAEMTIDATCGSVAYETLVATTTWPIDPPPPSVTTPTDPGTTPPPATPQPGTADFTG